MADKFPDFTETQLTSKTVYKGRLLTVLEDEVRLPDGKQARREYVRHSGAAAMIPLLDDRTVILVRQYRYPMGRHFYEIPAGKIDPGEAHEATARRELREECGYEAAAWKHLTTIHPCIGYSDERIELYLARDLTHVGHSPDEEEFLEVIPLALSEALAWIRDGKITDPKTVVGLLWISTFTNK
jgi:ADP-ribose pyrophosphatase